MRVIDARSGQEVRLGETVKYPGGESITLIDVDEGFLSASAYVERTYQHFVTGKLVTDRQQIPLSVRFTHPRFFLQKVAFIPS